MAGFVSHLTLDWTERRHAHFLHRLGTFSRLIRFDKRGTGMSDRPGALPDLETRMDDVAAVMDAVRSERAVLFGYSEGRPMSILYAASHPERVQGLVIYSSHARRLWAPDYPWGAKPEDRARYAAQVEHDWGWEADMRQMCPDADEELARWWGQRCRHDADSSVEEGRYLADHIPGAQLVELDGTDHVVAVNPGQILDRVEELVLGLESSTPPSWPPSTAPRVRLAAASRPSRRWLPPGSMSRWGYTPPRWLAAERPSPEPASRSFSRWRIALAAERYGPPRPFATSARGPG